MVIGKLKSMIDTLKGMLINSVPIKGAMLTIEGAGLSNPTIKTSYNITSVTRTGAGVYNVVPTQGTFFGESIGDISVITNGASIQPILTSELFTVSIVDAGGSFNIIVNEVVVGAGSKLEVNPYDIVAGDIVGMNVFINAGIGELPPP